MNTLEYDDPGNLEISLMIIRRETRCGADGVGQFTPFGHRIPKTAARLSRRLQRCLVLISVLR